MAFEMRGFVPTSRVDWASAISGETVASAEFAHCGGIYAGTSGVAVGVNVGVDVCVAVAVGRGVAVGGAIICVTKLHAINVKIKNPKTMRFIFIVYL